MNEKLQWQIDIWTKRHDVALRDVEFAEGMIDRLMIEAGIERPSEPPELYLIQGGLYETRTNPSPQATA